MAHVEIDEETYSRLLVTARLMDESVGDIVRRLVNRLAAQSLSGPASVEVTPTPGKEPSMTATTERPRIVQAWISIHKIYKGHRIEGELNHNTLEIRLRTEPWANKTFPSPTKAAVTVVEHFSGTIVEASNTNGRRFWKVTETGKDLRSIIGTR